MDIYVPSKHLHEDVDGGLRIFLLSDDGNKAPSCIYHDDLGKKYLDEVTIMCDSNKRVLIVPISMVEDYYKEGEVLGRIPDKYLIGNWRASSSRGDSERKTSRRRKIRDADDARRAYSGEGYRRLDVEFTIYDEDARHIKAFKRYLNKMHLNVPEDSYTWIKTALRNVKDGTITWKQLDDLCDKLNIEYDMTFRRRY